MNIDIDIDFNLSYFLTAFVSLGITTLLTFIIGYEREKRSHVAGFITHMLVGIGSCIFTLSSIYMDVASDKSRIASQIVSGVGFLGSATIFKSKKDIMKGINTAANLWIAAGIGLTVGAGLWEIALVASIMVIFVLFINSTYKKYKFKKIKKKKRERIDIIIDAI